MRLSGAAQTVKRQAGYRKQKHDLLQWWTTLVGRLVTRSHQAMLAATTMINVFREGWLESQTACWTYYVGDSRGGFLL